MCAWKAMPMSKSADRGFTLIEMLAVVAIVGILAAAAQPLGVWVHKRQREAELRLALRTVRTGLDAYFQAAREGRITLKAEDSGYPPDLDSLVQGVAEAKDPSRQKRIYFLRRLPRDPLADVALPAAQTWGLRSYDSPPESPAPGRDVFDVYSRAEGLAIDGSRYRDW